MAERIRHGEIERTQIAKAIWDEAVDPRSTPVEKYLAGRELALGAEIAGEVVRFHPTIRLDGKPVGGMVALAP